MLQRCTRLFVRLVAGLLDDCLPLSLRLCLQPPACLLRDPYGLRCDPGLCFFLPSLALHAVGFLECFDLSAEIIALSAKVLEPGGLRGQTRLHLQLHAVPVRSVCGAFFRQTLFGAPEELPSELIQVLLFLCCPGLVCLRTLCFESLHFSRETVLHFLLQPLPGRFSLLLHIAQPLVELFFEALLQPFLKRAPCFCRSNLRLLSQLLLTGKLLLEPGGEIEPPSYFKREEKPSDTMGFGELRGYIASLESRGFDVAKLRVQLHRKLAFPMVGLVMTLLAVPFSFIVAHRGALYGIGIAIVIAIVYWAVLATFEALGNNALLHPALAAWAPNLMFGAAGLYLILTLDT